MCGVDAVCGRKEGMRMNELYDQSRESKLPCCTGFSVHPSPQPAAIFCLMQTVSVEMLSLPVLLQAVAWRRGGDVGPGWSREN